MKVPFIFLAALAIGCARKESPLKEFNLGEVAPGATLRAEAEIENPFEEPAVIEGLDEACGVRVSGAHNGVMNAGERIKLGLVGRATRLAGPSAFKLELTLSAGKRREKTTYLFTYSVTSQPFLDKTETWVETARPGVVHVYGMSRGDRVAANVAEPFTAMVHGGTIQFGLDKQTDSLDSQATVSLVPINGESKVFSVLLHARKSAESPTCYPASLWLGSDPKLVTVQNAPPNIRVAPQKDSGITCRIEKNRLFIAPSQSASPGWITLTVRDEHELPLCSCRVYVSWRNMARGGGA